MSFSPYADHLFNVFIVLFGSIVTVDLPTHSSELFFCTSFNMTVRELIALLRGGHDISEGGFLKARLSFPSEFPLLPPKMRFITPMWHPNGASCNLEGPQYR